MEATITRGTMPKLKARDASGAADAVTTPRLERNDVLQLHHHAFISTDSERTRHFYEDILGLPLTMAVVLEDDIEFFKGSYCHSFYGLANGGSIAFFEYPNLWKEKRPEQHNRFEHHLALEVENDQALEFYRDRLDAHGIKNFLVDHHVYKSLAFDDPDGLNLEFICTTPSTAEFEADARRTAHQDLRRWMETRSALVAAEA